MRPVSIAKLGLLVAVTSFTAAACGLSAKFDGNRLEQNRKLDGNQLEQNRKLWNESGISDYRMKVHIQKPGHATPMGKYIIDVRERTKTTITSAEDPTQTVTLQYFGSYDTIDDIFEFIEKNGRPDAFIQQIEYDPTLGYPKKLHMDPKERTRDDELFFEVLEFEKL